MAERPSSRCVILLLIYPKTPISIFFLSPSVRHCFSSLLFFRSSSLGSRTDVPLCFQIFLSISTPFSSLYVGIYRGKKGRESYCRHGTGVVGWPDGHWVATSRSPAGFVPFVFSSGVRWGAWVLSVFQVLGERGSKKKIQGSKPLLRLPLHVQRKKKQHRAVQNGIMSCFFFRLRKK